MGRELPHSDKAPEAADIGRLPFGERALFDCFAKARSPCPFFNSHFNTPLEKPKVGPNFVNFL